ncbi:MFS transporter [Phytomonospora endophytica]|uniref:MFS family permease n=1 Tax=Phytomonospora endophytica TaxID=714109 RepID=A0A841G284_9ACTN|nr:MFS transporter [Phytomonospora endophytica]MBB6039757.1 MFS family permease [Phytomonospora endophytica]GIG70907.1 MFS transporter [Phytomonospora endophytica]
MTTSTVPRTRTGALAIASAAPLLVLSVYVVPLITGPETAAGVGAGLTAQTWIMNANPVGLAAMLLVTGSLADNLGRRRLFTYGAVALAVASAVGGIATTPALLIAARVGQGAAGAALLAASLGIVGHLFTDPAARAKATGTWAAALGAGLAVGPPLAGALTMISWRGVYWVEVAGAIALALVARSLPESRAGHPQRPDLTGMALLAAALVALLSAVTLGRTGWTQPPVLILLAATVALAIAFARVEARKAAPMLDLALFRQPLFLLATGGALLNGLAIIGAGSVTATIWQHAHHFSAFQTSLLFTLWSSASLAAALTARRLTIRPVRMLGVGYLFASAFILLLGTGGTWSLWRVLIGFGISGIGAGLVNAASARLAIDSVPAHRAGMGSGANNTARYIGSSVGVAVAISLLSSLGWDAGMDRTLIIATVLLLAGAAIAFTARIRPGATP